MKVAIILIIVFLATSFPNCANATSPILQEIAEQLKSDGQVLAVYSLLYDSDLKIIYAQHGNLFVISYARWVDNMWQWKNDDILEVFIAINQKPHILWSRQPPYMA
jgi:hypothetical protein